MINISVTYNSGRTETIKVEKPNLKQTKKDLAKMEQHGSVLTWRVLK